MTKTKTTGLGKGLSALIPATELHEDQDAVLEIEISKIKANAFQPRRIFDQEKLDELADSIKEHGIVQPIVVRELAKGKYELVAGERRLRASQQLGLKTIPAVIKKFTDAQMMEIALVENIQRQDLSPVEEAYAYKRLIEEFKLTQEQLAQRVSKSRSFIANMLRILNLPQEILDALNENRLTVGHARPLLALENEKVKVEIAQKIIDNNLSVRETESLVKRILESGNSEKTTKSPADDKKVKHRSSPLLTDLESKLRSLCGTKVKIKDKGGKGVIEIEYYSGDDLDRISALLLRGEQI